VYDEMSDENLKFARHQFQKLKSYKKSL